MNKRGIELSVNFLVITVIAIVVFGFGVYFVYQLFFSSQTVISEIDERTRAETERLLRVEGAKVAIPYTSLTATRRNHAQFGIGVLNINSGTTTFNIDVEYGSGVGEENNVLCQGDDCGEWVSFILLPESLALEPNHDDIATLVVVPDGNALSGTYSFSVTVTDEDNALYGKKIVYVTVP